MPDNNTASIGFEQQIWNAACIFRGNMDTAEYKQVVLKQAMSINTLLQQSIKSNGVINLFADVKQEFSLFDPKLLEEIAKIKKNLAVELLKKLIAEQVKIYRRINVVKSEKFFEIIARIMNSYLNGMLSNEEVIAELLKLAKEIQTANKAGESLGLNADELAFYDALTKPRAIQDFYQNNELIAITKELTEMPARKEQSTGKRKKQPEQECESW